VFKEGLCGKSANIYIQTKGVALEDVADIFGDGVVLTDEKEEAIHRRFKESHYHTEALEDAMHANQHPNEKEVGHATHIERTG